MSRILRTGLLTLSLWAVMMAVTGCGHCCKHGLFAQRPANCCPPNGRDPYLPAVAPAPPPPGVGAAPPGAINAPPAYYGPGPSADLVVPGPAVNGRAPLYYNGR